MRRIAALILTVTAFAAVLALPTAGGAIEPAECNRTNTYAKFLQPETGQVYAQTQLGGVAVTIPGSPVPSVSFSTTGAIEVKFEHMCLKHVSLSVYKDGVAAPIHTNAWGVPCDKATKTDSVTIGLDGGTYHFYLDGFSCNGSPLTRTTQGGVVGDPPLPV